MFIIDRKGDRSKKDCTVETPVIPSRKDESFKAYGKYTVCKERPVVIEDESEDDIDEEIIFSGLSSSLASADEEESSSGLEVDDASEADDEYIKNIRDNGEDYMIDDLQRMNLDNYVSSDADSEVIDDEAYAEMAANSAFMKHSPSTMMEFALDESAAEFLNQKSLRGTKKGKGKNKKGKKAVHSEEPPVNLFNYDGPYTPGEISFRQINREIKTFINDDVEDYLEMDPMPPLPRKFLHELAHMYGLKSKSTGQGRDRHCVLYKSEHSGLSRNPKAVKQYIERADKAITWMDKTVTKGKKFTEASVPKSVKESRSGKDAGGKRSDTKPAVGTVIGSNAKPISSDNVGNKLLQKLGWKPGEGLGSTSDGIVQPVTAVVRGKRTGLGHSHDN